MKHDRECNGKKFSLKFQKYIDYQIKMTQNYKT